MKRSRGELPDRVLRGRGKGAALALVATIAVALLMAAPAAANKFGFLAKWDSGGAGQGGFAAPFGVAADHVQRVAVADTFNDRVHNFRWDGTFEWSTPGPPGGLIDRPTAIAPTQAGHWWVADPIADEIKFLHNGGEDILFKFGTGLFDNPRGVASEYLRVAGRSGLVYVADTNNNRIWKVRHSGGSVIRFLSVWGTSSDTTGDPRGKLVQPWGVAVDPEGDVYVADRDNNRIVKFDPDGRYLTAWGGSGTGNGRFDHPRGVAADRNGGIYVADSGNDRVQKFSATGRFLRKWGSTGGANGQFRFPTGVAANQFGLVYVADPSNDRVQLFGKLGQPSFIGDRTLDLMRGRAHFVRIGCPIAPGDLSIGSCRGRLKLRTRRRVGLGGKRRKVVLARARFDVPLHRFEEYAPRLRRRKPAARRIVAIARIPAKAGVPARGDRQRTRFVLP